MDKNHKFSAKTNKLCITYLVLVNNDADDIKRSFKTFLTKKETVVDRKKI